MTTFSQYSIQVYCSSVACLLSLIIAICPPQIMLKKWQKILFMLLPLFVNVITEIIIVIDVFFLNGWDKKEISRFITETDLGHFTYTLLIVSVVACAVMAVLIFVFKEKTYNDKQLMRYYVKLTAKQNESGHIIIIGGSMDFLGNRPCRSVDTLECCCSEKNKECKKKLLRMNSNKKCKSCCLNNEQWIQLANLIQKGCRIQIVCTHPKNTVPERQTKELLGYILYKWRRENCTVRFFSPDKDPHIRGRVIEDFSSIKHVCWNFKTTNEKKNSYEAPHTFSQDERMGKFIIDAFYEISKKAHSISRNEENELIDAYKNRL